MTDINQEIAIAFQATQLILVFVTLLFTYFFPQIKKDLAEKIPKGKRVKERKNLKNKLNQNIQGKYIPLVLVYFIVSYLFFPLFIRVITESKIDLWNFDFARSSFVLIALSIFFLFGWSLILTINMYKKVNDIDKEDKKYKESKIDE